MSNCVICKEAATEDHHLFPIHLGGPRTGATIPLCGNCHTYSHQTAILLAKGTALRPDLDVWYSKYTTAHLVVERIVKAMIMAEENPLEGVVCRYILK